MKYPCMGFNYFPPVVGVDSVEKTRRILIDLCLETKRKNLGNFSIELRLF